MAIAKKTADAKHFWPSLPVNLVAGRTLAILQPAPAGAIDSFKGILIRLRLTDR